MKHLLLLVALAACTTATDTPADTDTDGLGVEPTEYVGAMYQLDFARASSEGVARGFDIDGVDGVCGATDYVDPAGNSGIDNAFAGLLPLMEKVGGAAFEDLIQGTVDSGEFLLIGRVREDGTECAGLDVFRASEPPLVGADGALLTGQTLPVRDGGPLLSTDCARYEDDRTVLAEGLVLPLELQIFDVAVDLDLQFAAVRMHLEEDGTAWGEAGGAIDVADLWSQIKDKGGIGTQLLSLLESVLFQAADVSRDGGQTCTHMSAALEFQTRPVFLYDVDETLP